MTDHVTGAKRHEHAQSIIDRTRAIVADATAVYRGTEHEARLRLLRDRLDEPLRVAIAGRVKSGKSTLLNALVGDRLAATDAGECTRVVTWYRDGHTYQVVAWPRGGPPRPLRFARDTETLEVDLDGLDPDTVERLEVTWPSQALRTSTFIDTPGIGSLSPQVSRRAWDLLAADDEETPADAVLYLMRHLHAGDLEFLRAFHDVEVSRPNPVNAIGILSRADEIGGGRVDSMASARRVSTRLGTEPGIRGVVQTVVPIAGLLAETAVSLTETEVAHLRHVADLPVRVADELLLTADRFVNRMPELELTTVERERLLSRFGVFGLRLSAGLLRRKVASTATELARELAQRSGLRDLRELLGTLFFQRRDVLKSRSALLAVDTLVRGVPRSGSEAIAARVEEAVASAHPFNELRVLSSIRAGWVTGKPDVVTDLERIIGGTGAPAGVRLGLPDAGTDEMLGAATAALARWQRRAENPLTSREMALAARVAVRSIEGMIAELGTRS